MFETTQESQIADAIQQQKLYRCAQNLKTPTTSFSFPNFNDKVNGSGL